LRHAANTEFKPGGCTISLCSCNFHFISEENVEVTGKDSSVFVTAMSYIYYLPGDKVITDLIIGNNKGDIGLVTCGKYIALKKAAHAGMINNVKITDAVYDVGHPH
jgi:hypothetical protein